MLHTSQQQHQIQVQTLEIVKVLDKYSSTCVANILVLNQQRILIKYYYIVNNSGINKQHTSSFGTF